MIPFYVDGHMDNNQDEICHETWNSFHGSSVQMKDIMSEKLLNASSEKVLGDGTIRF